MLLCGWKMTSIVRFVWNNQREGCWWADKVQWDASQPPLDLATEHLGKCGQTDESRLGVLPPKGRVTFSGDNMGLQWHRKHLPTHCSSVPPLLSSISPSSLYFALPPSANFPGPECCSLLPFHSVTGQKIWQSSKSLVAQHRGAKWMKMWVGSTKENDYRQERYTAPTEYILWKAARRHKDPNSETRVKIKEDQWTTWDAEHVLILVCGDLRLLSFSPLCRITRVFPARPSKFK